MITMSRIDLKRPCFHDISHGTWMKCLVGSLIFIWAQMKRRYSEFKYGCY